jgi:hypothetical protein
LTAALDRKLLAGHGFVGELYAAFFGDAEKLSGLPVEISSV